MINGFKIKEMMAFIFPQFITVTGFMIMIQMYGFLIASLGSVLLMILGTFIGKLIIKNPFTDMLKGNGLLTIPIDSKGIMTPFLCQFNKGELRGKFEGKEIKAPFDRNIVFNIENPKTLKMIEDDKGDIFINITKDEVSGQRFGMYQLPVLLYNGQVGSFITKDWLSEKETGTFARHHIIHANKIAERLTEQITNFGRYIADNAINKMQNIMESPFVRYLIWGFVIFAAGFVLFKYAPQFMGSFEGVVKP